MLADMLETWIFLHNNHLKDAHISIPEISEDIYEMFNEPMEEDSEKVCCRVTNLRQVMKANDVGCKAYAGVLGGVYYVCGCDD
jgi:hypothetical protein